VAEVGDLPGAVWTLQDAQRVPVHPRAGGRFPGCQQRRPDTCARPGAGGRVWRVERERIQRPVGAERGRGRQHRPLCRVLQDDARRPWRWQARDGVQMPEGIERRHVLAADCARGHAGIADELIERVAKVGDLVGAIRTLHRAKLARVHPAARGERAVRPRGEQRRPSAPTSISPIDLGDQRLHGFLLSIQATCPTAPSWPLPDRASRQRLQAAGIPFIPMLAEHHPTAHAHADRWDIDRSPGPRLRCARRLTSRMPMTPTSASGRLPMSACRAMPQLRPST